MRCHIILKIVVGFDLDFDDTGIMFCTLLTIIYRTIIDRCNPDLTSKVEIILIFDLKF